MPEIARFYGIIIYLFPREHGPAHFHAEYQEYEAVFDMATLQILGGSLPSRARSMVVEWATLHRTELFAAWMDLRQGRPPARIDPLP